MRKVAKTSFLGHFGPFFMVFRKMTENDGKYKKSACIRFVPINVPNFMPNFRKILEAISEKLLRTDKIKARTEVILSNKIMD